MRQIADRRSHRFVGLTLLAFLAGSSGCDRRNLPPDATAGSQAAVAACKALAGMEKQDCYEERLLDELAQAGVGPALAMLAQVGAADIDVERDGHVYTHAIGIQAYSPEVPLTDVFSQCSTLYQSGCYHGVIQAHFISEGRADSETVTELCLPYHGDPADRWILFQCLHGLGHGLTMYYGHNLPRALTDCDLLVEGWDRESCYGGVFMESLVNATVPHHPASELSEQPSEVAVAPSERPGEASESSGEEPSEANDGHMHDAMTTTEGLEPFEPLRADDPHYPCSVLESRYLTACYMMQTSVMLWHNGGDIGETARNCGEAPENLRRTCFQSLGRDVSSRTLQEPGTSLRECQKTPEEYREWCYVGLVKNFVDLTASTDEGFAFCRLVEEFAKPRCHEAMGEEIAVLRATEDARRRACAASETFQLKQSCLRGARVRTG